MFYGFALCSEDVTFYFVCSSSQLRSKPNTHKGVSFDWNMKIEVSQEVDQVFDRIRSLTGIMLIIEPGKNKKSSRDRYP